MFIFQQIEVHKKQQMPIYIFQQKLLHFKKVFPKFDTGSIQLFGYQW